MLTLLSQYLNSSYEIVEHAGPKTWVVKDAKTEKKYIVNQYLKKNKKARDSFELNKYLFQKSDNKTSLFNLYDDFKSLDKYIFMRIEYCDQGDLNGYLIENRFRNNKSNGEEQIKHWIIDLLDAIQFLNDHSLIHKRLNTYNIFIANDRLKIDGFEFVEKVNKVIEVKFDDPANYGMFNAPEIVKSKKINHRYHIWCLGWIIFEMSTCEWQHYRLLFEKFEDWIAPNLPLNSFSKQFNSLFKMMTKISLIERPSPKRLKEMAKKCFETNIMIKKENESDESGYSDMYLKILEEKYRTTVAKEDNVESLSEIGEEEKANEYESDLDIKKKFNKKGAPVDSQSDKHKLNFTIKDLLEETAFYCDYLVYVKNFKKIEVPKKLMVRQFRDASLGNNTKDRAELESFLRATEKTDNPYVTFYFDVFTIERSCLAYATEYFEECSLDKVMKRMRLDRKQFTEDKIFDGAYYTMHALNYLHSKNITHYDINPMNLYLRNNKIKVSNMATTSYLKYKLIRMKDNPDAYCYFGPELLENFPDMSSLTNKCDVWSVGCLMYNMYHLEPLFLNKQIKDKKYPSLPEFDASPKIKKLFNSCLTVSPADRPTSVELLKKMDEYIKKEKEIYKSLD